MDIIDLAKLIKLRRTIHNYQPEPIDETVLKEALELGLWSMNHRHTHPWRYYRLGEQSRKQMIDLMISLKAKKSDEPLSDAKVKALSDKLSFPAELIFIGQPLVDDEEQLLEDYATLSGAVHLTALALAAQGIGSKWSTGGFTSHAKAYGILEVDPKKIVFRGCLSLGIAASEPKPPPRPDLDAVMEVKP